MSKQKGITYLLILIIVFATISILAIVYFINKNNAVNPVIQTKKLEVQSNSTNIDDIEKDLNNTDLENVDYELNDIDRELNSISS